MTNEPNLADLNEMFDRVVVINLKSRPDRFYAFQAEMREKKWPFKSPELFEAVHGDRLPIPRWFHSGGGAFGCRQSHLAILQKALTDQVGSLFVFEDDAILCEDFTEKVSGFLNEVPQDWEGLMLGGQHHTTPDYISPEVVRVKNGQRTHAYACRGPYMRALFERWIDAQVHIDWMMKEWQHRFKVYAPKTFLIGQRRSKSDISGRTGPISFWNGLRSSNVAFYIDAPRALVRDLRQYGFHTGYTRDPLSDYDCGLERIAYLRLSDEERIEQLRHWIQMIQGECASHEEGGLGKLYCLIWHPMVAYECAQLAFDGAMHRIKAETLEQALDQISTFIKVNTLKKLSPIAIVRSSRETIQELRNKGFHTGYWRDDMTDYDNGLLRIVALPDRSERIREYKYLIENLSREAETIPNSTVALWHPDIIEADVRAATDREIILMETDDLKKILESKE